MTPEPAKLPMPRKQLEDAIVRRSRLYDLFTLRTLSDARLLELWNRLYKWEPTTATQ